MYLINYNESEYEKISTSDYLCILIILKISESETSLKKSYNKNSKITDFKISHKPCIPWNTSMKL